MNVYLQLSEHGRTILGNPECVTRFSTVDAPGLPLWWLTCFPLLSLYEPLSHHHAREAVRTHMGVHPSIHKTLTKDPPALDPFPRKSTLMHEVIDVIFAHT